MLQRQRAQHGGRAQRPAPCGLGGSALRRCARPIGSSSSSSEGDQHRLKQQQQQQQQQQQPRLSPLRHARSAVVAAASSRPGPGAGDQPTIAGAYAGYQRLVSIMRQQIGSSGGAAAPGPASGSPRSPSAGAGDPFSRSVAAGAAAPGAGAGGEGEGNGSGGPNGLGRSSSWSSMPDPWEVAPRTTGPRVATGPPRPPPPPANGNGRAPDYDGTDWGWDGGEQNWDPLEGLSPQQRAAAAADYDYYLARQRAAQSPARDKWMTPLLDWQVCVCVCGGCSLALGGGGWQGRIGHKKRRHLITHARSSRLSQHNLNPTPSPPPKTPTPQSITGAFDPDQRRTEDSMTDEALTNKAESREAIAFTARLIAIPLVTGACAFVGRAYVCVFWACRACA
jgi:hypothetical protein